MKVKVSQPQQEAWSNWKHADGMKFNVKKEIFKREEKKEEAMFTNVGPQLCYSSLSWYNKMRCVCNVTLY